jgi:hypothetical protein
VAGFNTGTGYSYGIQYGIFSFSVFSVGTNYSQNGGFSANAGWIGYNQYAGFYGNPSFRVGFEMSFVSSLTGSSEIVSMEESCYKSKEEALKALEARGFKNRKSGEKKKYADEFRYKEFEDKTIGGRTSALYMGDRLSYLSITMAPHSTVDGFFESFNHELIHAYDHNKYGLTSSESYRETKAYSYTDRFSETSSMPKSIPVYDGPMNLFDIPYSWFVPTTIPEIPIPYNYKIIIP